MMKKVLALILVLGMTSLANATIIDVVTVGLGDMGHAGTSEDPLVESETIAIQIVLNHNPYTGYPAFDGYGLDGMDLDLHVSGAGSLEVVQKEIMIAPGVFEWVDDLQYHEDFGVWTQSDPLIVGNQIASMSGGVLEGGIQSQEGGTPLVWNLLIHCDGRGEILVDLTLAGSTRVSEYWNSSTDEPYPEWFYAEEIHLGDLVLYSIPEPMTIALLGLGGLFLRRRR